MHLRFHNRKLRSVREGKVRILTKFPGSDITFIKTFDENILLSDVVDYLKEV